METKLSIVPIILMLLYSKSCKTASFALSENYYPTSCKDLNEVQLKRDIIQIQVDINKEPFYVKCNHKLEGGGWTVVLSRYDGSIGFNCKWNDCVQGFGNLNSEFFIGLEKLHEITSSTLHELMFIMEDFDNDTKTARYDAFAVDNEKNSYMIRILGNYTGDAGDSFTYHAARKFYTTDIEDPNGCAEYENSPNWFYECSVSNLFGEYVKGSYGKKNGFNGYGINWKTFRGDLYSLKTLTMLIRPVDF